ncbi:MAG: WD40 repeat domain-containing protein [Pyrinomonadaceae bacterium]
MTRVLLVTCVLVAVMTQAGCGFDGHTEEVTSVAFSPDGQYLLTSGHDGTARLWDIKTGAEVRRFLGHDGSVHRARFTPDGHYIASCGNDGILFWNTSDGTETGRIKTDCLEISISGDGKRIATGDFDSMKVWDIT